MARIRTLKPEFWDSPSTAAADLAARLLYMAMWNWADDSGHGTGNLKELEAFAFPNDTIAELPRKRRGDSATTWRNFAEVCGEVQEHYRVTFYRVAGRPYYCITEFKRHQSKDYRPQSKYPTLDQGEIFDVTSGNAIIGDPRHVENPPQFQQSPEFPQVGAEYPLLEQGNRGTGEQGNSGGRAPKTTGTKLPHDWKTTPEHTAWALEHCPNIDAKLSTQKFKSHYRSVAGPAQFKTDWDEAWKAWLISDQAKAASGQPLTASERRLVKGRQVVQRAANRQTTNQNPFEGKEIER